MSSDCKFEEEKRSTRRLRTSFSSLESFRSSTHSGMGDSSAGGGEPPVAPPLSLSDEVGAVDTTGDISGKNR